MWKDCFQFDRHFQTPQVQFLHGTLVYSSNMKDWSIACKNGLTVYTNLRSIIHFLNTNSDWTIFDVKPKGFQTRTVFSIINLINQSTIVSTNLASHHDYNLISVDIHQPVDI